MMFRYRSEMSSGDFDRFVLVVAGSYFGVVISQDW